MKKQGGWKFSWKLINGEAQITAGRMENFLKNNKWTNPSIWDLRVMLHFPQPEIAYTDMKKIPGWTKLGENIIDVSPF